MSHNLVATSINMSSMRTLCAAVVLSLGCEVDAPSLDHPHCPSEHCRRDTEPFPRHRRVSKKRGNVWASKLKSHLCLFCDRKSFIVRLDFLPSSLSYYVKWFLFSNSFLFISVFDSCYVNIRSIENLTMILFLLIGINCFSVEKQEIHLSTVLHGERNMLFSSSWRTLVSLALNNCRVGCISCCLNEKFRDVMAVARVVPMIVKFHHHKLLIPRFLLCRSTKTGMAHEG